MPKPEEPETPTGFTYLRHGAEREAEASGEETPAPPGQGQGGGPKAAEQEVEESTDDYPEDGTIPEVKDWIGEDLDRAQTAYDREQEKSNPRSTLLDYLDSLLSEDDDNDDDA
jgi:hypothetical protein